MDSTHTADDASSTEPVKLDKDVLARCARHARREGIVAGLTSGFVGAMIGSRVLRFDRNITLLSGILTGILSGYFFTQAFLGTRIAEAVVRETQLRRRATSSDLIPDEPL
ncbi:uncharacterized protein FOMMEDRAFT_167690 [Fomitiporia mediterranea MF3/22]|uniref:uncharacterized protein n=1 Tax=Fomitiporia mediterranea (strain MF3/22) TaxID=694068 RepID=UPI0004408DD0|nr:uncharacterized protein FOMMEDRAFT_167690 [Fomitiporia mediterranea MF3/22]EJD04522.1 hypothetical protein FOMMEDRAFT_167690 [Fomitiporia mediterranea MF3/22]